VGLGRRARAINHDWFNAIVGQVLVPKPRTEDVVILDILSRHRRERARRHIE